MDKVDICDGAPLEITRGRPPPEFGARRAGLHSRCQAGRPPLEAGGLRKTGCERDWTNGRCACDGKSPNGMTATCPENNKQLVLRLRDQV